LQSIIDKCRTYGTEGETIEHIISSCTVVAQSEYKKRHDIFAKIIHMNLAVKFNLGIKGYTTTLYSERQKYGINSLKIKQNFFQKNL
jgi:hypothetical protein